MNTDEKIKETEVRKRLLFALYLIVVVFLLLEGSVRLWGYSDRYIYDPIYMPCPECADIPFRHKPNLENVRGRGGSFLNTDSLGLRSLVAGQTHKPKEANEIRIAIAGESNSFGHGVRDTADTYPVVLEKELSKQFPERRIRVFNFSVSAYSVKEFTATLKCWIPQIEPDIVIMALVPDDFRLERTGGVDQWGYNVNYSLSGFVDKDSFLKHWLRQVHLSYVVRDALYMYRMKAKPKERNANTGTLPASYSYVKEFMEFSRSKGYSPFLLLVPQLSDGWTFRQQLQEDLAENHVPLLDFTEVGKELPKAEFMSSSFDAHPSAKVHAMIGEKLARSLKETIQGIKP